MASGYVDTGCYNIGESVTLGGVNIMFAGRVGWSGKEIWFTVPLDKIVSSDVMTIACTEGSVGTVYACTSDSAIDITNKNYSISCYAYRKNLLSVQMVFDTAPLSITDGIVNIMSNKSMTFTFS